MRKKFTILLCLLLLTVVCTLSVGENVQAKKAASVKEVYREMSKNFLAGKKNFSIPCRKKVAVSVVDKINSTKDMVYYSVLFQMAQATDKKTTTDDGDYLYGNMKEVNCYYSGGKLRFYGIKYFETKKQTKAVNQKVNKVSKQIQKKGKTAYKRISMVYKYVIDHVRYDERKNCNYSAYDGFYKKRTVCNGYVMMVYKLLMKQGIPCKIVTGSVKEGQNWYLHAWNMVKIKGKWYNLDACSDDADDGQVYADYFLKSDKTFSRDHKKDSFYCTKAFKKKYPMSKRDY